MVDGARTGLVMKTSHLHSGTLPLAYTDTKANNGVTRLSPMAHCRGNDGFCERVLIHTM
jgi:hypothetical protein